MPPVKQWRKSVSILKATGGPRQNIRANFSQCGVNMSGRSRSLAGERQSAHNDCHSSNHEFCIEERS
jgi:hypothetical protein